MSGAVEISESFACLGSMCAVYVTGAGPRHSSQEAVAAIKDGLLSWHTRFTRFDPTSELSTLNADPRMTVPASPVMRDFVRAVVAAAEQTEGLVDCTLLAEVQGAGYVGDVGPSLPLELALRLAVPRRPATPREDSGWSKISVDDLAGTVTRPVGVLFDSGGLAKGLFADLLAREMQEYASFAIDCAGDLRLGGRSGEPRAVDVASPFDSSILHTFSLAQGGVATSGIGKRSWLDRSLSPAHHLIDPGSGRPAYTGIVQATALAPSAAEAEVRAKAAILSGPQGAARWLSGGGALVLDNGSCHVLAATDDGGGSTDD